MRKRPSSRFSRREPIHAEQLSYTAVFEPAPEGGYVVTIPTLNHLTTEGDTLEEARTMAEDAIRCYLRSLRKHGEKLPTEHQDAFTTRIRVSLKRA